MLGITTEGLFVVQLVDALLVMSWVDVSLKVPTAWNCAVPPSGTAVTIGLGHVVSTGVGLMMIAVEVETGVGDGGGPGHSEMLSRNAPGGDGTPQGWIMPSISSPHGVDEPPPPPQLHEKATASNISAAPIRTHRALAIIGIQL